MSGFFWDYFARAVIIILVDPGSDGEVDVVGVAVGVFLLSLVAVVYVW